MVTGNTLIELGYKPAKWFGEAIEEANHLLVSHKLWQINGETFLWNVNVAFEHNTKL